MKLRPMIMADADKMLEWKNYPETRMFAIASQDEIKKEDHLKWLEKNIQYFQMILEDEVIMGAVRVQGNEVSIWIDRAFWGKGLATKAIEMVSQPGFTAKIVEGNIASMKCFIKCGYAPVEYVKCGLLPGVIYEAKEINRPNYYIFKL